MAKKIGVLLSGCGVFDGSEIHEAVLTMLFLDQAGAEIICMAPDIPQVHVIDHITQKEMNESRNVLVESARIARGEIKKLSDVQADDLDGLIIPGGFGSAKNLSDFALKGPGGEVNPDVKRLIDDMVTANKPIGALCIAPATVAMALKDKSPELTIGSDEQTIGALQALGVKHTVCAVDEIAVDNNNKIVSTPAYMLGPDISHVAIGIEKLVKQVLSMV